MQLGKLLLAVAEMQSFIHNNWTSAQSRHSSLPSSGMHFCRAQMRHSSMLAVHARPMPQEEEADIDVEICIRRKKLSEAWKLMKSVDGDLWTDVCRLYSLVVAVGQNAEMYKDEPNILDDVAEAKVLMRNAEILSSVEIIESFRQEEWSNAEESTAIRHGSELTSHRKEQVESVIETKVRHIEHANAWQMMKNCDTADWTAACLFHEELMKALAARKEMLDCAVWIIQDFNPTSWTSSHTEVDEDPHWRASQIRHGSTLAVHECPPLDVDEDPSYHTHRERMIEAWKVMKAVGSKEWTEACKTHEDFLLSQKEMTYKVGNLSTFRVDAVSRSTPAA